MTQDKESKTIQRLNLVKNIIWPVFVGIFMLGTFYAVVKSTQASNTYAIEKLEVRTEELEDSRSEMLQRLSSIEAKQDYANETLSRILDILDNLSK